MPTTKKRINVSLDSVEDSTLSMLAKKDRVPKATKAAELLRVAMEIQEDVLLANIAEDRIKSNKRKELIPHEVIWK